MPTKINHKHHFQQSSSLPKILIVAGIVILVTVILTLKNKPTQPTIPAGESAEVQLDQYLAEGKPTFVFFHSNNCQTCIDMIHIVDDVYPDYKGQVALVDVNVYDPVNENLLQRARITSIPTQVFIDTTGQGKVAIGVMTPEQLRLQLQVLAGGDQ